MPGAVDHVVRPAEPARQDSIASPVDVQHRDAQLTRSLPCEQRADAPAHEGRVGGEEHAVKEPLVIGLHDAEQPPQVRHHPLSSPDQDGRCDVRRQPERPPGQRHAAPGPAGRQQDHAERVSVPGHFQRHHPAERHAAKDERPRAVERGGEASSVRGERFAPVRREPGHDFHVSMQRPLRLDQTMVRAEAGEEEDARAGGDHG